MIEDVVMMIAEKSEESLLMQRKLLSVLIECELLAMMTEEMTEETTEEMTEETIEEIHSGGFNLFF
jgi:hypothetical protein